MRAAERSKALEGGGITYFTGKPCKFGHVSDRYTKSGMCVTCKTAHRKKWRAENHERTLELQNEWRRNNPEIVIQRSQRYYKSNYPKNREKLLKKAAELRKQYPEKYREISRQSRLRELERNPQAILERAKRWRKANPDRVKANLDRAKKRFNEKHPNDARVRAHNRRAKLRSAGSHTRGDIDNIFKMQRGKCAYCRVKLVSKYHIDHIVPVAKGGRNDAKNLQLLCAPCNHAKWCHDPIEFSRKLGRLL